MHRTTRKSKTKLIYFSLISFGLVWFGLDFAKPNYFDPVPKFLKTEKNGIPIDSCIQAEAIFCNYVFQEVFLLLKKVCLFTKKKCVWV